MRKFHQNAQYIPLSYYYFVYRVVVSAIANQIPWDQIKEIIKEATDKGKHISLQMIIFLS